MWLLLLMACTASAYEQITNTVPSLILFVVNKCEDCDTVQPIWEEMHRQEIPHLLLDEVNCDFQETTCHDFQITTFPSVLFVSQNGMREFEEDFNLENLMGFVQSSESVLINGEDLLTEEDSGLLQLQKEDLDILGRTHALIYFMYDEEIEHVEDFVLSLRAHVSEQMSLPVYIIDCGELTDICIEEPFLVRDLPSIKYFGETILGYQGDLEVEKVEWWLKARVFKTIDDVVDPLLTDESVIETTDSSLVYMTSDVEFGNVPYMEGVLLAFFLTEESVELEELFKTLSRKYRANKDLQIFAVHCDEYNAPKACKDFPELPTVQHGFMGRLVKELSLSTEDQFDGHIAKLLQILADGGHILRRNLGKIFELTISNFGEQIHRYEISFIFYYTSACGRCEECESTWNDVHYLYANHPLILPGRVDCNFNRGTCKQAETRGSEIVVYYKGVYHSKYYGQFEYQPIVKFLEKMYREPPQGAFTVEPEDKINAKETVKKRQTNEEKEEAQVEEVSAGEEEASDSDAQIEERSGHALIITSENYNSTLTNNKLVFIKFFVPWCGHCQKLKPTWKLLAHSFREVTDIVIGMVNCQNEQELCRKHLIYGYPALFAFVDGKQTYRYREDRTLNDLIAFVKDKYYLAIEDDLKYNEKPLHLTGNNVWNVLGVRRYTMTFFTANNCEPCDANLQFFEQTWAALREQPPLFEKIMLTVVACNLDIELCRELEVRQVPYIIMFDVDEKIDPGSAPTDPLLNPFKAVQSQINNSPKHITLDVVAWHKKTTDMKQELALEAADQEETISRGDKKSTTPVKTEPVTELGTDTFKAQLKKSRFTLVKFYAPWCGHCRKLAPIWDGLGDKYFLNPDVVLAKVNCDANEKICEKHKVNVYPTLYMFENDRKLKHACKKRKKPDLEAFIDKFLATEPLAEPESAPSESVQEVPPSPDKKLSAVKGAMVQLDRSQMVSLLESVEHNYIFVNFYYGSEVPDRNARLDATWDRIATLYLDDDNIVIARVNCDVELRLCVRYQVQGNTKYPQVLLFDKRNNINHVCTKRGEDELIAYIDSYLERDQPLVKVEL